MLVFLGNLLTGKGIVKAGSGNKKGKRIVRAGSGGNKKGKGIVRAYFGCPLPYALQNKKEKKNEIFNSASSFNKY